MKKTLTITLDEDVYKALLRLITENDVNKLVESLIHRYIEDQNLEEAYRMMAQDEIREAEALEWAEATVGDISDETNYTQSTLSKVGNPPMADHFNRLICQGRPLKG